MFVIYVDICKEACREVETIFREGPIEGFWQRLASSLERGHFSEKEEGGEMSAIYYTER